MITNFNKGAKTIQWKKNSLSKNWSGTTRYVHAKAWSWIFLFYTIYNKHHHKVKGGRKPDSPFPSECNDPQNHRGKWKQVRTKISISASSHVRGLCPLCLFRLHSTSSLLRVYYVPSPEETKQWAKQTYYSELPHDPSVTESHPAYRTQRTHTYHCQPVEQWLQPQAKVYSWRIFQSTWSSWKSSRKILEPQNRKHQRGNPHILWIRSQAHKEEDVTETKSGPEPSKFTTFLNPKLHLNFS